MNRVLIILFGVALIVGLGINYFLGTQSKNNQNITQTQNSLGFQTPTPHPTPTPTPDQTINWKVYTSKLEKASF
jgi:hypothetical protein